MNEIDPFKVFFVFFIPLLCLGMVMTAWKCYMLIKYGPQVVESIVTYIEGLS